MMNKEQFLARLEKRLRRIPQEERENIMLYYQEYFEEAGPEQEQEVIQELGSPDQIAADMIGEFAVKELNKGSNKGLHILWIVILAIFASPIAIPIAVAMVSIILALAVCAFAIVLSIGITAIGMVAMGIFTSVVALMLIVSDPATCLFFLGIGLLCGTIGMALCVFTIWLSKQLVRGLVTLSKKFLSHRRGKSCTK